MEAQDLLFSGQGLKRQVRDLNVGSCPEEAVTRHQDCNAWSLRELGDPCEKKTAGRRRGTLDGAIREREACKT